MAKLPKLVLAVEVFCVAVEGGLYGIEGVVAADDDDGVVGEMVIGRRAGEVQAADDDDGGVGAGGGLGLGGLPAAGDNDAAGGLSGKEIGRHGW